MKITKLFNINFYCYFILGLIILIIGGAFPRPIFSQCTPPNATATGNSSTYSYDRIPLGGSSLDIAYPTSLLQIKNLSDPPDFTKTRPRIYNNISLILYNGTVPLQPSVFRDPSTPSNGYCFALAASSSSSTPIDFTNAKGVFVPTDITPYKGASSPWKRFYSSITSASYWSMKPCTFSISYTWNHPGDCPPPDDGCNVVPEPKVATDYGLCKSTDCSKSGTFPGVTVCNDIPYQPDMSKCILKYTPPTQYQYSCIPVCGTKELSYGPRSTTCTLTAGSSYSPTYNCTGCGSSCPKACNCTSPAQVTCKSTCTPGTCGVVVVATPVPAPVPAPGSPGSPGSPGPSSPGPSSPGPSSPAPPSPPPPMGPPGSPPPADSPSTTTH